MSGGELGELCKSAGYRQPSDRVTTQILQSAAYEIAHIDQGVIGQVVKALNGALRGRSGRGRNVVEPSGAGDIDPAVDGVDPRSAGVGDDDAGCAEDSQSTDTPEPRVHRLLGKALATGDRDRHSDIRRGRVNFGGRI